VRHFSVELLDLTEDNIGKTHAFVKV